MKLKKLIAVLLTTCAFAAGTPFSSRLYANAVNLDDIVIDIDASLEQEYEFTLKNDGTYEISGYIREIEENPVFTPSPDIYLPKSFKAIPHRDCASDAQSDFSSDCTETTQEYHRISRSFCAR